MNVNDDPNRKWYHYKLNFKKEIHHQRQDNDDVGFIIAGVLGNQYLSGALFVTNAQFMDARTAKEYLGLTYAPRFRVIAKLSNDIQPVYITDGNNKKICISQRTCPAFGQHGGVGEWIIPTEKISSSTILLQTDHYYLEGGSNDRWHMAAWDRQLLTNILPSIIGGFTGKIITGETLKNAQVEKVRINALETISGIKSFWDDGLISIMIVKPHGLVTFCPIQVDKTNKYQMLAYLSISCGYSVLQNNVYLKLWGSLWEDYINFRPLSRSDAINCDNIPDDVKNPLTGENPSCFHHATMGQYAKAIMNYGVCGVRLCSYFLVTGDTVFPLIDSDAVTSNKLSLTLSELVRQFKEALLSIYRKPNLSWCNAPKTVVLLPKLGVNVEV